jgi:uncharacterized protein
LGNEATFEINGKQVNIVQKTEYPWDGNVNIQITPESEQEFTLVLRIPGWAKGATVKLNGELVDHVPLMKNGYVYLNRTWNINDQVESSLPMVIERIQANPRVRQNVGKVALQRGPIVYCIEEVDNASNLHGLLLLRDSELKAEFVEDMLDGVVVISGEAERIVETEWDDILYKPATDQTIPVKLRAIPYYAWCNREPGEMIVWINEKR